MCSQTRSDWEGLNRQNISQLGHISVFGSQCVAINIAKLNCFPSFYFPRVLVLHYVIYVLCLPCCQATSCHYGRICTLQSLFIMIECMVVHIPGFVCASLSIKVAVALCLALCSWLKSELVTQLISHSKKLVEFSMTKISKTSISLTP